jgi:hypothetical protein
MFGDGRSLRRVRGEGIAIGELDGAGFFVAQGFPADRAFCAGLIPDQNPIFFEGHNFNDTAIPANAASKAAGLKTRVRLAKKPDPITLCQ